MPRRAVTVRQKGKCDPPTNDKKKNLGCRNIDGKEYYYCYKDKIWKIVDNQDLMMGNTLPPVSAVVTSPSASAYGYVATSDSFYFSIPRGCSCHYDQVYI